MLTKTIYGEKTVPNVKIKLYKSGKVVYEIFLDCLKEFRQNYDSLLRKSECYFSTPVINVDDLKTLLAGKYDSYDITSEHLFRNGDTGEDETVFFPTFPYNNISISYSLVAEGDPAVWEMHFYNEY